MLNVQGQYRAWTLWLGAFGRGEDLPTDGLAAIDERLGPHMQERLLFRLNEAVVERQRVWSKALRRDQEAADPTPLALATVLVAARTRLLPLVRLARNPLLPANVRSALEEALATTIRSAQRSLEESARRQPRDVDVILDVVRVNALTAVLQPPAPSAPPASPAQRQGPSGRTVII